MINLIIESISISLNAEFGDRYRNYSEEKKQDLKEPCFFIQCLNPGERPLLGRRYFRSSQFCIQYFPETEQKNAECNDVAERMLSCLEYLTVDGAQVRGTKMHSEMADDILNFFVNYNMFIYKEVKSVPVMEGVSTETSVKGQVMK